MNNPSMPNGQQVATPQGKGSIIETIGDKVVVKLENGDMATFAADEVEDDSSAG